MDWKAQTVDVIRSVDGVFSVDADELENTVTVGITEERSSETARARMSQMGIPDDAIRIVVASGQLELSLYRRFRPVESGL